MADDDKAFLVSLSKFAQLLAQFAGVTGVLTGIAFIIGFVAMDARERALGLLRTTPSFAYAREGLAFFAKTVAVLPTAIMGTVGDVLRGWSWTLTGLVVLWLLGIALLVFGVIRLGRQYPMAAANQWLEGLGWSRPLVIAIACLLGLSFWYVAPMDAMLSNLLVQSRSETAFPNWAVRRLYAAMADLEGEKRLILEYGQRVLLLGAGVVLLFAGRPRPGKTEGAAQIPAKQRVATVVCTTVLVVLAVQLPAVYGVLALEPSPTCVVVHPSSLRSISDTAKRDSIMTTSPTQRTRFLASDLSPDVSTLVMLKRDKDFKYNLEFYPRDSVKQIGGTQCLESMFPPRQ